MKPQIIEVAPGIELHYYPNWISDPARFLIEAEAGLSFTDEVVTMFNKSNIIRRRTVDYGLPYSYNATAKPSIEWEPVPLALRQRLYDQFKVDWQQCACNEYMDQRAYIGPHHDKPAVLGQERREPLYIASISVGAERKMVVTPPGANLKGVAITVTSLSKVPGSYVLELASGSLLLFSNAFNRTWKHSIPMDSQKLALGKRISLTYRHF